MLSACGCDHRFTEATCTTAKTCTVCGETEGEALGHLKGEAIISEEATIFNYGKKIRPCARCGMELTSERYELVNFYADGKFLFSAEELTEKYNNVAEKVSSSIDAKCVNYENNAATEIDLGGAKLYLSYYGKGNYVSYGEKDSKDITEMEILIDAATAKEYTGEIAEALIYYFISIDPLMSMESATDMYSDLFSGIVYNSEPVATAVKNGIAHILTLSNDSRLCLITYIPE